MRNVWQSEAAEPAHDFGRSYCRSQATAAAALLLRSPLGLWVLMLVRVLHSGQAQAVSAALRVSDAAGPSPAAPCRLGW